jgi:hypothetical protein
MVRSGTQGEGAGSDTHARSGTEGGFPGPNLSHPVGAGTRSKGSKRINFFPKRRGSAGRNTPLGYIVEVRYTYWNISTKIETVAPAFGDGNYG